jgi:DNA-binding transcriptional regulator YiaG
MKMAPADGHRLGARDRKLDVNVPQSVAHLHLPTHTGARRLRRKVTLPVIVPSMAELAEMRRSEEISQALAGLAIDVTASHLSRCERGERQLGLSKRLLLQAVLLNHRKPTAPVALAPTPFTSTEKAVPAVTLTTPARLAYPIAGGSGPVTRATSEQLQQLANHFNQRRIQ